ncbi:Alcohol dehydrogenase GroES domain protein [Kribbella flavida DSM 17836]|uniref:Alcohol dehydrogenase GroES domain protein n=1 Tax=Kribbella flavida (strain DSM 17836 / JCM 10339 / NBRC 14399) TaxID=479435 RepID=D2PL76_KRIFD|nr:NADP-dependent oxidoreductase [Kribbella flavida]ADB34331.1 Alcohol dehydrogenase GroES domain protein [Kribbella flavida DSM 17836]
MRALVARRLEGPAALELITTDRPDPRPGEVRIKVAAAAVNPVDVATSDGSLIRYGIAAPREQFGTGWDVAGTVDATGPGVGLAPGTPVIGLSDLLGRPLKTHAEYVVLGAHAVAPAPAGLDFPAASTFALNARTAQQAVDALGLSAGQTLLVTGAAGGVGGYAVELGKYRGLTVIATASGQDEELVRSFGADHFVSRSADLTSAVHDLVPGGVDGLVDAAVLGVAAQEAVRNNGVHAHVIAGTPPTPLRGISVRPVFAHATRQALTELVELVEQGILSTRVAATYPLDDAVAAYERVAKGGVRGRVVLVP